MTNIFVFAGRSQKLITGMVWSGIIPIATIIINAVRINILPITIKN